MPDALGAPHELLFLPLNPLNWCVKRDQEENWLVWLGKRKPQKLLGPCPTSWVCLSFFHHLLTGQIDWKRSYLRNFIVSTDARILYTGHLSLSSWQQVHFLLTSDTPFFEGVSAGFRIRTEWSGVILLPPPALQASAVYLASKRKYTK